LPFHPSVHSVGSPEFSPQSCPSFLGSKEGDPDEAPKKKT
jgi:hypothetical protein